MAKVEDDLESDLGKTLSPLGSTSSLQDLIECSSARGSVDPMMPRSTQSSAWIERERYNKQQKPEPAHSVRFSLVFLRFQFLTKASKNL